MFLLASDDDVALIASTGGTLSDDRINELVVWLILCLQRRSVVVLTSFTKFICSNVLSSSERLVCSFFQDCEEQLRFESYTENVE